MDRGAGPPVEDGCFNRKRRPVRKSCVSKLASVLSFSLLTLTGSAANGACIKTR